jgi:hypothetical protein
MTKSIWGVSVFSISLGLAVPLSTIPASASEAFGLMSTCDFVNPDRLQCNFPQANRTTQIQYVSMQCNSTGGQFSLNLFQFWRFHRTTLLWNWHIKYRSPIRRA